MEDKSKLHVDDLGPTVLGNQKPIAITGTLSPFNENGPLLFTSGNKQRSYVAVFTNVNLLHEMCALAGYKDYTIKHVDDGKLFVEDVYGYGLGIMYDPHMKENGKVGWFEPTEIYETAGLN